MGTEDYCWGEGYGEREEYGFPYSEAHGWGWSDNTDAAAAAAAARATARASRAKALKLKPPGISLDMLFTSGLGEKADGSNPAVWAPRPRRLHPRREEAPEFAGHPAKDANARVLARHVGPRSAGPRAIPL